LFSKDLILSLIVIKVLEKFFNVSILLILFVFSISIISFTLSFGLYLPFLICTTPTKEPP